MAPSAGRSELSPFPESDPEDTEGSMETARLQDHAPQVETRLLSAVADALPVLIRRSDGHGRCTYANRRWLSLTGRRLEEELGTGWVDALHPDDRESCLASLAGACEDQQPLSIEYRLRRHDGGWRWLYEEAAPHDAVGGTSGGFLHVAFDITGHKDGERRLRQLLDRQRVSLEELGHRAVNRSQLILSLLRLQAREAADSGVRAALEAAAARVQALVLADQRLGSLSDSAAPKLGDCLQELAAALKPSFEQRAIGLEISVDDSEVPPRTAAPLGLMVNELLMNSLKHAFPEGHAGTVKLVGMRAGDRLKVLVADDGVGLAANVEPRRARSSGMRLIDGLAKQIGAEVMIERSGGTCVILTVPIGGATLAPATAQPDGPRSGPVSRMQKPRARHPARPG
jgi:two-component system, sensor histidine kinase PdtaS